jgi:hypothetical protein
MFRVVVVNVSVAIPELKLRFPESVPTKLPVPPLGMV